MPNLTESLSMHKSVRVSFILSVVKGVCVALLLSFGIAKCYAALGSARVLEQGDPVLFIRVRDVMLFAGILEVLLGVLCIVYWRNSKAWLVVFAFSVLVCLYRALAFVNGFHGYCRCMGDMARSLSISDDAANQISLFALFWLVLTSLWVLITDRRT